MSALDLTALAAVAEGAARAAGVALMDKRDQLRTIESASAHDLKIVADRIAEKIILEALAGTEISVLSEEAGRGGPDTGDDVWIIDPLDGSANFNRGLPICCVSIALLKGPDPVLGVIYDFNRDEMFTGVVGGPSELNGRPFTVSDRKQPDQAILMTGMPPAGDFSDRGLRDFRERASRFMKVRYLGSAALSLAYVACGRADAYREDAIRSWDVAAGAALVIAAGGAVRWHGADLETPITVSAGNSGLLDAAFGKETDAC